MANAQSGISWYKPSIQEDPGSASGARTAASGAANKYSNMLSFISNKDILMFLDAMHNMYSWHACKIEGKSWEGTADENIQKYWELFYVSLESVEV
jgi:hypothetical protein